MLLIGVAMGILIPIMGFCCNKKNAVRAHYGHLLGDLNLKQ